MKADETYQGFTNTHTWAVALIIDNNEPLYKEARLRVHVEDDSDAADALQDMVLALVESKHLVRLKDFMVSQLVQTALWAVNWRELVEHYREKS